MNERFNALAKECYITSTSYFDGRGNVTETYFDKEKFAELIVQECVNVLYDNGLWGTRTSYTLNEHFGVKE